MGAKSHKRWTIGCVELYIELYSQRAKVVSSIPTIASSSPATASSRPMGPIRAHGARILIVKIPDGAGGARIRGGGRVRQRLSGYSRGNRRHRPFRLFMEHAANRREMSPSAIDDVSCVMCFTRKRLRATRKRVSHPEDANMGATAIPEPLP